MEDTLKIKSWKGTLRASLMIMMLFMSSHLFANYKFYSMVRHVCKAYQVEVSFNDMRIHEEFDSKMYLDLNLKSGRNNFDTVLIVGFVAAGKALENSPEMELEGVNVTLNISARENNLIIASASANDIVRLVRGDITSSEFKSKYLTVI